MGFLRFVGRSMLASYFIVNGARSLTAPADQVAAAEPLADKFVPLAQNVVPESITLPTDPKSIVRAGGAAEVLGGLALATGLGRRLGAATLLGTLVPQIVASAPTSLRWENLRTIAQGDFLRNLALAGACALAAQDTEGSPSLAWRADDQSRRIARAAAQQQKALARTTHQVGQKAGKQVRTASRKVAKKVEGALN